MSYQLWRERRKTGLGGSDAPILVLGQYYGRDGLDLYKDKKGLIPHFEIDSPDIRRGNRQEPVAIQAFCEQTHWSVERTNEMFRDKEFPFLIGNVDGLINGDPLEVKSMRTSSFSKLKRQGISEGHLIQMSHYMRILGTKRAYYCAWCPEEDELWLHTYNRDDELIDLLVQKEVHFWTEYIEKNIPPPRYVMSEELLEKIHIPKVGGEVVRLDSSDWLRGREKLRLAKEVKAEAEALEAEAKAELIALMGEYEVVEGAGLRIHHRFQKGRESIDTKRLKVEQPDIYAQYLKVGKPIKSFRPYFLKEE